MLTTGQYAFRLRDVPKAQAKAVEDFVRQHAGTREWMESKIGKRLDLSKLTFKFGPPGLQAGVHRLGGIQVRDAAGLCTCQPSMRPWRCEHRSAFTA
jgi:hypothetical protein